MKRSLFVVLAALFALVSCGSNQVLTTLQLVVASSEAAVAALEAGGTIDPNTAAKIENYLTSVSTAASFAATELASSDSTAVKAAKIVQEFATVTAPDLPAGTPQVILTTVNAVVQAVLNFLATVQPAPTAAAIKISEQDKAALKTLQVRADAVGSRVRRLKK